jgi:hypothetical protein
MVVLKAMAKEPDDRFGSALAFKEALGSIDLGDDDAVPLVVRDPTPPGGVASLPRRRRPAWLPLALVGGAILLVLALLASVLSPSNRSGRTPAAAPPNRAVQTLHIASVRAFDPPPGDGHEHDSELNNVIDGDRNTAWQTEHYNDRKFGRIKDGLGLVLTLDSPAKLRELRVNSPVQGWAASVYVAPSPADSLGGWGQPVDTQTNIAGSATFNLKVQQGGAVLLWITDLGPDSLMQVNEVTVAG